jgi:hypothetical protein
MNVLTIGYVLLDLCVRKSRVWTDGAIIHQSAAGDDLCSMRDRNVWVMKKVVWSLMAYAQLRDLAGSAGRRVLVALPARLGVVKRSEAVGYSLRVVEFR